jgi:broad specificity phosphatase PhoE
MPGFVVAHDEWHHGAIPATSDPSMARIHLIRHAQASLMSDDYDQLSPLGITQSRALGAWFAARGEAVSVAVAGTLKRQSHTASECLAQLAAPPALQTDAGFDEYGHDELFGAAQPGMQSHADAMTRARASDNPRRAYQALISAAFVQWVSGADDSRRRRSWATFRREAVTALERVAGQCGRGQDALIVSSGGVIAAICQHLLGLPDDRVAALHWVVYNASVTRLLCNAEQITLSGFNSVAHLEAAPGDGLVTYR